MDFDEEDEQIEAFTFNEDGNELMPDGDDVNVEGEEDADGEDDGEGSDDGSSASDDEGSDSENDDDPFNDDPMDVDAAPIVRREEDQRSARLNGSGLEYNSTTQHTLQPSLQRQRLFYPATTAAPPRTINFAPLISVPLASPVHALAASLCLGHVLTGSQDGYVRDWDTYASASGGGGGRAGTGPDGGIRAGVCKGWWAGEGKLEGNVAARVDQQPVYSLACQRDGLWGLAGTASGNINLFTIRHAVGTSQHVLAKGHVGAVSSLALGEREDLLYSGGWDGGLVEWDLHTGKQIRSFPTQSSQISSISLQPPPGGSHTSISDYNIFIRDPHLPTANGTLASSVDPPDASNPAAAAPPPPLNNGRHSNDDASTASSRRLSDLDADAEGEDDALTSADAEGEKDAGDIVIDSNLPSPTPTSPPAPHPDFPLPATNGNGSSHALPPTADETAPKPLVDPPTPRVFYPSLTSESYSSYSQDILLTSGIDGSLLLWDRRVPQPSGSRGVASFESGSPPWCMSAIFSPISTQIFSGRRNGTVEVWDVRRPSSSTTTPFSAAPYRILRNPAESGPVSSVVAFPNGKHIACSSSDSIRLWSTSFDDAPEPAPSRGGGGRPPFRVVAGLGGGRVSSMVVDPLSKFLITASGSRGWGPPNEGGEGGLSFHALESVF